MNGNLNPAQFHPHLNDYKSGGMGHLDDSHSVVGYVKVSTLRKMHGNDVEPGHVEHYRNALRSGEGFKEPLLVEYNHNAQAGFVGDGNHRLEALHEEGIKYAPVRVVRSRFDPTDHRYGRSAGRLSADISQWSRPGYPYVPSDIHPAHVFGKRDVYK